MMLLAQRAEAGAADSQGCGSGRPRDHYGQSFGGAAAVDLDWELGIPVTLSLHIDSVGANDHVISGNVGAAVNFYEREGFPIRGQAMIVASGPARTKILGNLEYRYRGKQGSHLKMEDDPLLWSEVQKYILRFVKLN